MKKKSIDKITTSEDVQPLMASSKSPYVFISHDTRDADLAEEFSKLLSSVSLGILKTFRSSDKKGSQGIEYGTEWYPEIMKKLDQASDIVCLLTENSLNRPWILYEAGVAKGKLNNTKVFGIGFGISSESAYTGPFAQFQNCGDDEEALTKLVYDLVKRIPNTEPNIDIIKTQVKTFIKEKDDILSKQPRTHKKEDKVESAVVKLFEEVKIMFQDLPSKIEGRVEPEMRRRHLRLHPKYIDELLHFSHKEENNLFGFLILISIFKNDFPWLYEIGMETYKTFKESSSEIEVENATRSFERIVEITMRSPLSRELVRFDKEFMFMFEEMHFMLRRYLERFILEKRKVRRVKLKSLKDETGKE